MNTNDSVLFSDWEYLYNLTTPAERFDITCSMLKMIEDRRDQVLELCKSNPKHLETLPTARLREISDIVSTSGRALILSSLQFSGDSFLTPVLDAYEGLTIFGMSKDEPTAADLKEAIEDIKAVWEAENKIMSARKDTPTAPRPGQTPTSLPPSIALRMKSTSESVGFINTPTSKATRKKAVKKSEGRKPC